MLAVTLAVEPVRRRELEPPISYVAWV